MSNWWFVSHLTNLLHHRGSLVTSQLEWVIWRVLCVLSRCGLQVRQSVERVLVDRVCNSSFHTSQVWTPFGCSIYSLSPPVYGKLLLIIWVTVQPKEGKSSIILLKFIIIFKLKALHVFAGWKSSNNYFNQSTQTHSTLPVLRNDRRRSADGHMIIVFTCTCSSEYMSCTGQEMLWWW